MICSLLDYGFTGTIAMHNCAVARSHDTVNDRLTISVSMVYLIVVPDSVSFTATCK